MRAGKEIFSFCLVETKMLLGNVFIYLFIFFFNYSWYNVVK